MTELARKSASEIDFLHRTDRTDTIHNESLQKMPPFHCLSQETVRLRP